MIKEYRIRYGAKDIPVQIIRSYRKTMAIQIGSDCTVKARIPYGIPDHIIQEYISKHQGWIVRKYTETSARKRERQQADIPSYDELDSFTKKLIKEKIVERVLYYSELIGVSVGRVTVRNQKTRWGSCSSKGNVNFNYRLYYMPEPLLNYVVVHELAHRRHMNHSLIFWEEVSKYCPDYKERRKQLREYSLS